MVEGPILGAFRRPHNDLERQSYNGHASIHDGGVAKEVGFKAAPIHGTVHFSQFAPLFLQAFGPQWFETGTISVHFKTPVKHLEPVRACMDRPQAPTDQVRIWMEKEDGTQVLEGTASGVGTPDATKARSQISKALAKAPEGNLVILDGLHVGDSSEPEHVNINFADVIGPLFPFTLREKLQIITENHPWYTEAGGTGSPWGAAILPPEMHNALMCYTLFDKCSLFKKTENTRGAVSLFGGCEVRVLKGPIRVDKAYTLRRQILAIGETPKTEFCWFTSQLYDPVSGVQVAEMLLQLLFVKKSMKDYAGRRARLNPTTSKL